MKDACVLLARNLNLTVAAAMFVVYVNDRLEAKVLQVERVLRGASGVSIPRARALQNWVMCPVLVNGSWTFDN